MMRFYGAVIIAVALMFAGMVGAVVQEMMYRRQAVVQSTGGENSPAISGINGDLVIDGYPVVTTVSTALIITVTFPDGKTIGQCFGHIYDAKPTLDVPLKCTSTSTYR